MASNDKSSKEEVKPYFKEVDEPSYFVQLHYDALYDSIFFYTLYRFATMELAEEFLNYASNQEHIECHSKIFFNIKKLIPNRDNHRPLIHDFDTAIKDLNEFKEYCNTYYYNTSRYKYKESVIEECPRDFEIVFLRNENERLKIKLNEKK